MCNDLIEAKEPYVSIIFRVYGHKFKTSSIYLLHTLYQEHTDWRYSSRNNLVGILLTLLSGSRSVAHDNSNSTSKFYNFPPPNRTSKSSENGQSSKTQSLDLGLHYFNWRESGHRMTKCKKNRKIWQRLICRH